jgi:uncharacterized protein (DUF1697 family)
MRYVAFLRAINTGKRRIKMIDLRHVYIDLGFENVATYIATGNVIFDSDVRPDISRLEDAFEETFGFSSEVFLRDARQIGTLLERIPWQDSDGVVEVSFLGARPHPDSARALEATVVEPEALVVSDSEVLFLREGKGVETTHKESTSMRILWKKMTRRGEATVRQIHGRFLTQIPEGALE